MLTVCLCVRLCLGSKSRSDVTDIQVSLFYSPVGRHLLGLVAFHVLLHGSQAWAEVLADGALVWRSSVMRTQVFDHGRVVSWALVAKLTLKWLLTYDKNKQATQGMKRVYSSVGLNFWFMLFGPLFYVVAHQPEFLRHLLTQIYAVVNTRFLYILGKVWELFSAFSRSGYVSKSHLEKAK